MLLTITLNYSSTFRLSNYLGFWVIYWNKMALLAKSEEFLVFSAQRKIFILNTTDQTHSITQVPRIARKKPGKNASGNGNADEKSDDKNDQQNEENDDESNVDNGQTEFGDINYLAVSSSDSKVAVTTVGDKFLFIYQLNNGSLKLLQNHQLARAVNVLRFTPDSKQLLIADKTGDCSILDCQTEQPNEPKWILGHLSIVLDALMTKDLKYVISSDRDEKVRVTNYPLTELIESYCLGHTEYVSAIEELTTQDNQNLLVSISGDRTLRLWNYVDGTELFRLELPARGLRLVKNGNNQLATVLFDDNFIITIFELSFSDNKPIVRAIAEHTLNDNVKYVSSIIYESNERVLFSGLDENSDLVLKQLDITISNDQATIIESNCDNALTIAKQNLTSTKLLPYEDIANLFKSRKDNTAEYLENKRRRLEKKHARLI